MVMRALRRLRYWLRLSSHDDELAEELALHREMVERDLAGRGMSPDAARLEARRTMGNETHMREQARSVWLWPSAEAMWQDATYSLRSLRRSPAFTAGVVITLALGIGANTAMFSLVDRLLFRPPARMIEPEMVHQVHLYRMVRGVESPRGGIYARYIDVARASTTVSEIAGVTLRPLAIGAGDETRLGNVGIVSASFFRFFDAPPIIGRYFSASEDAPPTPAPVVVLSQRLWATQFGSRADVLGSLVQIDAVKYTVIGVAPEELVGLWPYRPPLAFVPVATYAASRGVADWATSYGTAFGLGIIARRKDGVTIDAAAADLTTALRRSYQTASEGNPNAQSLDVMRPRAIVASVLTERGPAPSSVVRVATWLSGITLIVLIIACANVANLLLARALSRRREIAVRVALGISRARLFGQLLVEAMVLAVLGGGLGLLIALWGNRVLRAAMLPDTEQAPLLGDPRTLLFAIAVTVAVGLLTGLIPMAQLTRGTPTADLKSGAREGTYHRRGLRTGLLVVQCALSSVLLIGAGLFVQSLRHVRDVPLGFDADSVLVVSLNMRDVKLDDASQAALRLRLLESAKRLPMVSHAALQESVPFGGMSSRPLFVDGIDSVRKFGEFHSNTVSADFFATMGTRILRGRAIDHTDGERTQPVAVVGESMAAVLWPGQDPIGRCFRIGADTMPCRYVAGVAEDIRSESIDQSRIFFYYLPAAQWNPADGGLFVRPRGDARRAVETVRSVLQQEMPGASFVTVRRLGDIVDAKLRSWIVGATVFTAFGALALLLAAVGLYSVIAYNVAQRRHEMGVRLALGAARGGIVRLVLAQGLFFALAGIAIGSVVAIMAGSRIAPLLFQQSPRDPMVFAIVSVTLLAVAVVASCVPALRAAGVDPKTALQAD